MQASFRKPSWSRTAARTAVWALFLGIPAFAASGALATEVTLSGTQEVPSVDTKATGSGQITVGTDKSVNGNITTTGIDATAAHIHEAPPGKNGGVIVPLVKSGSGWAVPPGSKLTDAQYKAYMDGNLYVNVHSAAHKGGEIRGQLKP